MDEIIQDDRRVNVDTIARTLGIGHNAVQEMIESLGYRKVCARALRLLTEDHKGQQKAITSELLQRYRHEGDDFLLCIVTGDESWFHRFEPETKRQSMKWHHLHCSVPVGLACYVIYSAGLYLQVQGRLHWSQITTTCCIITQKSAGLIYFVAIA